MEIFIDLPFLNSPSGGSFHLLYHVPRGVDNIYWLDNCNLQNVLLFYETYLFANGLNNILSDMHASNHTLSLNDIGTGPNSNCLAAIVTHDECQWNLRFESLGTNLTQKIFHTNILATCNHCPGIRCFDCRGILQYEFFCQLFPLFFFLWLSGTEIKVIGSNKVV